MALQWEGSSALLANERTVAGMHAQVSQQVVLEGKALFALAALIGTLGRMEQQMRI